MGKKNKDINIKDVFKVSNKPKKKSSTNIFINRELSWLEFNKRVMYLSISPSIPFMERLNFLGITSSNLDEFIMVRLASIYNRLMKGDMSPEISGLTPDIEYKLVFKEIIQMKEDMSIVYYDLLKKLEKKGICIKEYNNLGINKKKEADIIFDKHIYPLLTPLVYDTTKELPNIKSKELTMGVIIEDSDNSHLDVLSIISLSKIPRIFTIKDDDKDILLLSEDIIMNNINKIFINKKILSSGFFRLLRNSDIELSHTRDIYLIDRMKEILSGRNYSNPIMMEVSKDMDKKLSRMLRNIYELDKKMVYENKNPLDLSYLLKLPKYNRLNDEYYEKFTPQFPKELIGETDLFSAMDDRDFILHHPYESFDPVVKLIEHAAQDKNVQCIRQTLYRVSSEDSPIVEALCLAGRKGKDVTVLLEIKARFDESQNISLVDKLKNSGCKLVYGIEELKTHCKMISITKNTPKGMKLYSHVSTGNYNDKTANIYTDVSLFTSCYEIGIDLITLFNVLSGFSTPKHEIENIYYSPYNIRYKLSKLIDKEKKKGSKGYICLKLNSLCDEDIITQLYEANDKGCRIDIICRGICSASVMRVDGRLRKNFNIKSIVGRYLEHSRIYKFGDSKYDCDIFISSADMITRNLDKRIELMIPITAKKTKKRLNKILERNLMDNVNSFIQGKNGLYFKYNDIDKEYDIFEKFINRAIKNYKFRSMPKPLLFKKK